MTFMDRGGIDLENYFEVKRCEKWLYSIKDKMGVYCWLAVGEDSALLLDTGYGIGDLPGAVKNITAKPLTVVLSHGHADHALGSDQFDKVYLHNADSAVIKEHCGEKWRQKALTAIAAMGGKVGLHLKDIDTEAYLRRSSGTTAPLREGEVFDLGGLVLHTVHMPGHTPGSCGLFAPKEKILLTGDASNRATFMFLPESLRMSQYLDTLRRVSLMDFTVHYVGHQDTAYPKKWFDKYIKVTENALAGKGKPMKIPGFEEYEGIIVSSVGGPIVSPAFCAVAYTKEKL